LNIDQPCNSKKHRQIKEEIMRLVRLFSIGCLALALSGCAGMSARDKCVAGGALIGGVTGSVLTDGGTVGTLGGAALGGVVGHEIAKDRRCP
jgi:osmotically inducible lipoprotein OsmB